MASAIRYLDVKSALGNSLTECVDHLLEGKHPWSWRHADQLDEPLQLPYFGFSKADSPTNNEHFLYPTLTHRVARAIDQLALTPQQLARTGLFLGSCSFDVAVSEQRFCEALTHTGLADPVPLSIIGYGKLPEMLRRHFLLSPYCYSYSTACTSSANALLYAHRMLESGMIDRALVIGMEFFNHTSLLGFYSLGLISPSQSLKPFSADRDGLILGEAIAIVVLERDSTESNTAQLAISGGAINTDNHSLTAANSDGSSLASVISSALVDANISPEHLQGIKSHGTASLMNDEAESAGLARIFSAAKMPPVFALKSYCGHTLGACGALELALTSGCLLRDTLPANPGHQRDPALGLALNTSPGIAPDGYYLLNCFAFGGNNNALILRKNSFGQGGVLCS